DYYCSSDTSSSTWVF
nr:immunoglobulin light chain junction region [Macaca mulatta]